MDLPIKNMENKNKENGTYIIPYYPDEGDKLRGQVTSVNILLQSYTIKVLC